MGTEPVEEVGRALARVSLPSSFSFSHGPLPSQNGSQCSPSEFCRLSEEVDLPSAGVDTERELSVEHFFSKRVNLSFGEFCHICGGRAHGIFGVTRKYL